MVPGGKINPPSDPVRAELDLLQAAVERARRQLPEDLDWQPGLQVLAGELQEGEPFVFRVFFASSSMSKSDTPVTSS